MGIPELRQAIADNIVMHGGAQYSPENIVVTPGGQQAMFIIALGLLDPGDELLIPCPGYNPYLQAAELTQAKLVEIRTSMETNFTITAEMVRQHITPRSKVLVLINPGNPTGSVIPPEEVLDMRGSEGARPDCRFGRDWCTTYDDHHAQPVAAAGHVEMDDHTVWRVEGVCNDRMAGRLFRRSRRPHASTF